MDAGQHAGCYCQKDQEEILTVFCRNERWENKQESKYMVANSALTALLPECF